MSGPRPWDWRAIAFLIVVISVSGYASICGQPLVHGNEEARGVIVNVFSILAGFLVTVMTLLGEPGLFWGRTWKRDAARRENVHRRLLRHKILFTAYLVTLALVFCTTIVAKRSPESNAIRYLESLYLFVAICSFVYSLVLPSRLMSLQLAKLDELIAEGKREQGDG